VIHGAVAVAHLQNPQLIQDMKYDYEGSDATPKMKALLRIAGMVVKSGREVSGEAVESAIQEGASEMDVHDTVLIAATFCMFNRYVDGLGTEMPRDLEAFAKRGAVIAEKGYEGMPVPVGAMGKGEREVEGLGDWTFSDFAPKVSRFDQNLVETSWATIIESQGPKTSFPGGQEQAPSIRAQAC
jgi:hypothetical protein